MGSIVNDNLNVIKVSNFICNESIIGNFFLNLTQFKIKENKYFDFEDVDSDCR